MEVLRDKMRYNWYCYVCNSEFSDSTVVTRKLLVEWCGPYNFISLDWNSL